MAMAAIFLSMKPHFRSWDDSRRSKFASVGTAQAKKADGAETGPVAPVAHQALMISAHVA
jgi:hypothetical protein